MPWKQKEKLTLVKENDRQKELTSPIRFSRHSITELLVAAEQTASKVPYNSEHHKHKSTSKKNFIYKI